MFHKPSVIFSVEKKKKKTLAALQIMWNQGELAIRKNETNQYSM